jgi:hypothetical protein
MTDFTQPTGGPAPEQRPARADDKTTAPTARAGGGKRRHPAARARIAAAGIGVGAMVGLAANMDVTYARAHPANANPVSTTAAHRAALAARQGAAAQAAAVAKANRPIVLAIHTVVTKVNAPAATGGGYVGSSYTAPASGGSAAPPPPPPVATTSGSTGGG